MPESFGGITTSLDKEESAKIMLIKEMTLDLYAWNKGIKRVYYSESGHGAIYLNEHHKKKTPD